MDATFARSGPLRGRLTVPGDKSIAHRAILLAGMASGTSRIEGIPRGKDVMTTAGAMTCLGADVRSGEIWTVKREGWHTPESSDIDCRNSGTTMRLLMGALAGASGTHTLRGDESLSRRPMRRVASPLQRMGAEVETIDGHPPVTVVGAPLTGIDYELEVPSAQVKSAVLLAGLQAEGSTVVRDPFSTRDHTERLLRFAGAPIESRDGISEIKGAAGPPNIDAFEVRIPGDFSSAAFLMAAACLIEGSELRVEAVGLNPSRTGFLQTLRAMGADMVQERQLDDYEPSGDLTVRASELTGIEVDPGSIPSMIDELPLLALVATQASGTTVIRGASELRVKESDRIASIVQALRALGAEADELPDGLTVNGPTRLSGAPVDSGGDHRIALTLAVAGLISDSPVVIHGWECSENSFPEFRESLTSVVS